MIAYDATVPEGGRTIAVVPYFDAAFEEEGRGTYWVPVALGPWRKRGLLHQVADAVARGRASEYSVRRGLPPR